MAVMRQWPESREIDGRMWVPMDDAQKRADDLNDLADVWARRGTHAQSQLRGAVEALEVALDGLERTNRDDAWGYEDKKAVEDYVRGTLNRLRGR